MQTIRFLTAAVICAALGACSTTPPPPTGHPQAMGFLETLGARPLMSPAAHNITNGRQAAGNPVRRGKLSERYELRDGDCGGSDCGAPRARAEMQLTADTHSPEIGQDIWYGYSFRNVSVPSFSRKNALRLVFGQWTMGGTSKPVFRFIQLGRGEADFASCDPTICATSGSGDLVVQLSDMAQAQGWGKGQNNGYVCRLFDLEASRGQWMDIVVHTNFSAGSDGYLRIWVNDAQVCDYKGPLVSAQSLASGQPLKHRRGIFASWTQRWTASEGARPKPRLVVYYDEFRTGRSMREVDVRQLAALNAPPVN